MAMRDVFRAALDAQREAQAELSALGDTQQKRLERAIQDLDRRVVQEALQSVERGGATFGLTQALEIKKQLEALFAATYGAAVVKHAGALVKAARLARRVLASYPSVTPAYAKVTQGLLDALQGQTVTTMLAFGEQARARIGQALVNAAVAGRPHSSLVREIAGALVGHKDVRGRPLAAYARVYAQDSLQEVYATVQQQAARRAGLRHYLYFGTAVRDSRPFCLARMGKVFTEKEVLAWEGLTWAGKKAGPILVTRGGWNCRHQLVPVEPEWVDKDLGDYLGKDEVR